MYKYVKYSFPFHFEYFVTTLNSIFLPENSFLLYQSLTDIKK